MWVQRARQRPRLITVLGVLAVLGGIAGIVAGGALLVASLAVGTITLSLKDYLTGQGYPQLVNYVTSSNVAMVLGILGTFSLLVGIFWVAEGIGALRGKGWAWTMGVILVALSMINSIIQVFLGNLLSLGGVGINLLFIYYLGRTTVRAFFGKTLAPAAPPKN